MPKNELTQQKLEAALRSALAGSAVLFVGAGVSHLVQNSLGSNIPNGNGLSDIIHDALNIERRKHSLPIISDYFKKQRGTVALKDLIESNLSVATINPRLKNLYKLSWRRIYTTNYDNAIELARQGAPVSSFAYIDPPKAVPPAAIIHLNGSLSKAIPSNIDEEITLTDTSYAVTNLMESDWINLFISDLKIARSIIFVGYSLQDLDIARVLIAEPALSTKTFIFVGPESDDVEISRIEKYGHVFKGGTDLLFEKLDTAILQYVPPTVGESLYHSVELTLEPSEYRDTSAQRIFKQLVFGQASPADLLSDQVVFDDVHFLVERTDAKGVVDRINDGSARDVFVTGDIASGKTFCLFQISRDLLRAGEKVIWINSGRYLDRDFDLISRYQGSVTVVVDGYANIFDSLKRYLSLRPNNQKLLLAERTATHEIFRRSLDHVNNFGPSREITLAKLNDAEAQHFDQLMNFAGLWGDQAGLNAARRIRYITADLQGSLYRLLIEIIKSKKVQEEIKGLLNPLLSDENSLRFFVTAFIVNVLEYNFWINDWQYFYSVADVRKTIADHKSSLSHFINVDAAQIYMRSGILSGHILRNFTDDSMILDCLVDMYDCASRNSFNDDEFAKISFDLRLYNRIEPMFGEDNKLKYLRDYYEQIRQFGDVKNNADYWLQFGIAMSIHGDLDLAETAFVNAYSRERAKSNPNTTKIDNYYARFELERAIYVDDRDTAYTLTRSGANKLMKQTFMDNNRHYPFKTGRSLSDIASKHYLNWSGEQKSGFRKVCLELRDRAIQWNKANRSENRDVNFLINDVTKLEAIFEGI